MCLPSCNDTCATISVLCMCKKRFVTRLREAVIICAPRAKPSGHMCEDIFFGNRTLKPDPQDTYADSPSGAPSVRLVVTYPYPAVPMKQQGGGGGRGPLLGRSRNIALTPVCCTTMDVWSALLPPASSCGNTYLRNICHGHSRERAHRPEAWSAPSKVRGCREPQLLQFAFPDTAVRTPGHSQHITFQPQQTHLKKCLRYVPYVT